MAKATPEPKGSTFKPIEVTPAPTPAGFKPIEVTPVDVQLAAVKATPVAAPSKPATGKNQED